MKCSIYVSGQIMGNSRLVSAISTYESETKSRMFNAYEIIFPTKKAAYKALWEGYKYLVKQEPEFKHGIRYSKKSSIYYDASSAVITSNE